MTLNKLLNLWPPFGTNEDDQGDQDQQSLVGILQFNADGASQTVSSGTASGSSLVGILQEAP